MNKKDKNAYNMKYSEPKPPYEPDTLYAVYSEKDLKEMEKLGLKLEGGISFKNDQEIKDWMMN